MVGRCIVVVVGIASLLSFVGCSKSSGGAASPAYLRVSPANVDFGKAWPGQVYEVDVELKNQHPSVPILITNTETSCDCTVATVKSRRLAPGEAITTRIAMRFGEALGDSKSTAVFNWKAEAPNDSVHGMEATHLLGHVVDLVKMPAKAITLGDICKDKGVVKGEFKIGLGNSDERVDSMKMRSAFSAFTGECFKDEAGGFVLKYQLDPAHLPIGSFHETIELIFCDGSAERGTRRIYLSGSVRGGVRASPPTVMFTALEKGKVASEVVRIRAEREGDVLAVNGGIEVQNKLVDVEEATRSNSEVELRISMRLSEDKLPDGNGVSDTISIPISVNGVKEVLKVPILGFPLGE